MGNGAKVTYRIITRLIGSAVLATMEARKLPIKHTTADVRRGGVILNGGKENAVD